MELSQRSQTDMQIVSNQADLPFFDKPATRTRWMAGAKEAQKRVMSRSIQVRQQQTKESGFAISVVNKYMLGSIYP